MFFLFLNAASYSCLTYTVNRLLKCSTEDWKAHLKETQLAPENIGRILKAATKICFFRATAQAPFRARSFALLFSPSIIYSECFHTLAFPPQHVWMNELQCISYKSLMRLDVNTTIRCYKHNTTTALYINSFCNICLWHLHSQTHIWPKSYEPSFSFFPFFVCFLKCLHD